MTEPQSRPDLFRSLLAMQGMLDQVADERGVAAYLCQALRQVPGIEGVQLCCRGRVVSGDGMAQPCGGCAPWPDGLSGQGCRLQEMPGWWVIPLRTRRALYGFLACRTSVDESFDHYRLQLDDFARVVATLFENHELLRDMQVANRSLAEARQVLEERVAERTARLTALNRRLEEEVRERKAAEERANGFAVYVRSLIEACPDPIVTLTPRGLISDLNDAAERATGLSRYQMIGTEFPDYFTDPEAARTVCRQVFAEGTVKDRQLALRHRSGAVMTVLYNAAVFPGESGRLAGAVAVARDITVQKAHEGELERARVTAEEASVAKSRFLAAMSHELRTPLNAILGFSEILERQLFGPLGHPKYSEYAADIHASGDHLLRLIKDILDISKIEAGRMEVEPCLLPAATIVEDCQHLMAGHAARQGVTLGTELPDSSLPDSKLPDSKLYVWADECAVRQILLNLLANAIKFTPAGGTVTVGARPGLGSTGRSGAVLFVADTGIGIPADQISRVAQPFERADNRYGRAAGGTGLGLALVKGLTELHGGEVVIESRVGTGTTVSVWLPARP